MKIIIPVSRLRRLTSWILFFLFSLSNVYCQENSESQSNSSPTRRPQNFVTGKLNQFNGFYTPRPLPSNANFVYASIWASWSAWSFCANNVQIRVRACNTVRGFTCPGANQERKPCGPEAQNRAMRQRQRMNGFGGDYDAVDPWEEDRREALKQLYSDYTPPDEPKRPPSPPLRGIGKSLKPGGDFAAVQRSAGKTVFGGNHGNGYGNGPIAPLRPPPENDFKRKFHADGSGQAPSMTPELLFGSKLEIPAKRIKSSSSESKEQKLEGFSAERKEEEPLPTKTVTKELMNEEVPTTTAAIPTVPVEEMQTAGNSAAPIEGKTVLSTETNQNPLKMGMNHGVSMEKVHPLEQGGGMEDITKTDNDELREGEESQTIDEHIDDVHDNQSKMTANEQAEREVFGEAAITDILPHLEITTLIPITDIQPGISTKTEEGLNSSQMEETSEGVTDPTFNVETVKANSHIAPADSTPELLEQAPEESKAEEVSPELPPNFPPKSQPPPPMESVIPPHAAFEHEDDSDLMAPPPPQSQESLIEQSHFKQPTIKISPSKSTLGPVLEEHEILPKDEMYDDQFEAQNTRTTVSPEVSPEDKIKQLEADMDALENQITKKLHSGEVSFNKDTEKALEWMLANMTKAAEEAALRQEKLEAEERVKATFRHQHIPPVHSGEVAFPLEGHEGETKGIFGKPHVFDNRQFAAKISPLDNPITLRKIQPEIQKQHYDNLKYQHAKVIKPIQLKFKPEQSNPEAELLESDLKRLRTEMAKMQSELVALQGDTSIVEVKERTTIGPNLKAINLELVPKGPKPPLGGPENTPIVSIGNDGKMFLLDVPSEKGEAQWSLWREWGDCFCDKQIRTRICNYDSAFHSKGCQGKSFESRPCITSRPCPAKTALKQKQARTTPNPLNSDGLYTLAPQKGGGHRTGYAFKPNPLSVAISSSSSSSSQAFN